MFLPALTVGAATAGAIWALFEAQWVELNELDVPLTGLAPELDGFRIFHVSDFHLGTVSLNGRAFERAVSWAESDDLDLVAMTGDLLSRQRGEARLRDALRRLRSRHGTYAILGNHDVDVTRDPFSRPTDASAVEEEGAVLLEDEAMSFDARGRRVQVVGGDPR